MPHYWPTKLAAQLRSLWEHVEWLEQAGGGGSPLAAWPVGSVYIAADTVSPAVKFGGGTWVAFGAGRALVGLDPAQAEFDTIERRGGEKTHELTVAELAAHTHAQDAHAHRVTDPEHTHLQGAHNHATAESPHSHTIGVGPSDDTSAPFDRADAGTNAGGANAANSTGPASTGLTIQNATATNRNASTGVTVDNATATNQAAGGGRPHNNLQPYLVVRFWKRAA